jgi:shikimate dehydrogenase
MSQPHPRRPDRPWHPTSRTPALHEHEGDAQALRYLYRLIDADQLQLDDSALPGLLDAAQRTGFTGLNITYPFKQAILPLLDELSDEARGIGAVNTVVLKDGKRVGHNTDCLGFAEGLRRDLPDVAGVRWCRWAPAALARPWPMRCWVKG